MTPEPTQTPIPWATLTPYPTTAATAPVQLIGVGEDMSEKLVQGYQMANSVGAIDMLMFSILLFIVVGGVWSVIKRLQSL